MSQHRRRFPHAFAFAVALSFLLAAAPEPKPFIRDFRVGYLLQYNFLSPRPYCWPGEDAVLSGWEVDKSGGTWACQPNCHYPDGFAFHSDWFKLVDTSKTAAVTIKHQIARQTQGKLTLEFRFKLPTRMDGAAWQLRDLQDAAISITTAGENICHQSRDGAPLILQAYKPGRDYGVKVVADLADKTADIFVDGDLRAERAPFCRPVESIDYVLIKTGDTATGEMFLGPVNVHKGYAVNETFVTGAAGQLPGNWQITHGAASVEQFECGTKPDIFSLKLSGTAANFAEVITRFPRIEGKTVLEYRLLLTETLDGGEVELMGRKRGLGPRIFSFNGGLWTAGKDHRAIPLVQNCRTNLWYTVKIVADPKPGIADVWVNGKLAATRVQFSEGVNEFLGVAVASRTTMWIDDILVYPWEDYPADYVPQPKPVAVKNGYLLGAQSCNLWREGNSYAGWDYVYPHRAKREPYLGWYDEGHPEETDWEIKWQVEHGIGFEMHCWYRPNNAVNHPIKDGVLDQGIIKGLFNARYSNLAKFAIMCTDEGACETNPQDWRENIIPYWIEYFFKDPRYLKIDGKPVLSIYHLGNWQRMFGGAEGSRQAIGVLRDEMKKAGFPGIIVLMEYRGADARVMRTMKEMGVDYCYAYTWGTPDAGAQRRNNLAQRDAAAAAGLGMLPSISMGWDREAWGVHDGGWTPLKDYTLLATWARDEFMPSLPEGSLGRGVVMLPNWNEFGEGHFLMPSTLAGFGYLDALREVFTVGGPHEDVRPTAQQKRRFGVLYPKD
ncbi:MAG: glycoside hydrolase family 99-like domain-containing protein [Tepidisphaerales bacterium]